MHKDNKKVYAAILIIGNEILSGRTKDQNTADISIWLNSNGVQVKEVRIIPDVEKIIIANINKLRATYDYVFTTGGIGPTHDDITAQSVSRAFKKKYSPHKEAYRILENYYKPGEFNEGRKRMTMMPENANLIYNPSSGAPGFYIENVFCLPGVPDIMKSMLPFLKDKIFGGKKVLSKTISVETVESEIAKELTKTQNKFKHIEIGSYPFFRSGKIGVSIVIRSENQKEIEKCSKEIIDFMVKKSIKLVERN